VVGAHDHDVVIEEALLIRMVLNCPHPVADNLRMMQLDERGSRGFLGLLRYNDISPASGPSFGT